MLYILSYLSVHLSTHSSLLGVWAFVSGTINTSRSMLLVESLVHHITYAFFCLIFIITPSMLCSFLQRQTSFPIQGDKGREYKYYILQISSNHSDYYSNPEFENCPAVARYFSARILKNQNKNISVLHKELVRWFIYIPENYQCLLNSVGHC